MYWLGLALLGMGAMLLGFSNPWRFFEAARGSFFDWSEFFWHLQWAGFWLTIASLLVFGGLAWKAPATFAIRWRAIPAGIGLILAVLFFACSMPEKSNEKDWKDGWLGARTYVRTKLWMRKDNRGEDALPDRLTGHWRAPGGYEFKISPDAVHMLTPEGETEWSAAACRYRFRMDYDYAYRSNLERPVPPGLTFTAFDQTGSALGIGLPDRRFPRLTCSCDSQAAAWVLVDIDWLLAYTPSDQMVLARRR